MSLRITSLPDGSPMVENDWLVIARDGRNYKINGALAGIGALAVANNLSDVDDAATALANIGGVPLSGDRALQLYDYDVILDSNGNGDYTTLQDAIDNVPFQGTIYIASDIQTNVSGTLGIIDRSMTIILGPDVSIVAGNLDTTIFEIQGAATVVHIAGTSANTNNRIFGLFNSHTIYVGATTTGTLSLTNIEVSGAGNDAIRIENTLFNLTARNCHIGRSNNIGIHFPNGSTATQALIDSCYIEGVINSVLNGGAAMTDAPFYNCTFEGPLTNVSFSEQNLSNVDVDEGSIGPRGMSLYTSSTSGNTLVVDASGNGDYTDIATAVAAASTGDTVMIFGQHGFSSGDTITVNAGIIIELAANGFLVGTMGAGEAMFDITSGNTLTVKQGSGGMVNILGPVFNVLAGGGLTVVGGAVRSNSDDAIVTANSTSQLVLNTVAVSSISFGAAPTVNSLIISSFLDSPGDIEVVSGSWDNAAIYNTAIEGTLTNVNLGIGNNSNVLVGNSLNSYAGISAVDNAVETAISLAGTPVQVTIFDTNDPSNFLTPDHTNDHITIDRTGDYFVAVSATVNSTAGTATRFEMTVQKNNGTALVPPLHVDRNIAGGAGGNSGSVSMSGIATLTAADTIEVWLENETNTQNYTVEDISLSIMKVS